MSQNNFTVHDVAGDTRRIGQSNFRDRERSLGHLISKRTAHRILTTDKRTVFIVITRPSDQPDVHGACASNISRGIILNVYSRRFCHRDYRPLSKRCLRFHNIFELMSDVITRIDPKTRWIRTARKHKSWLNRAISLISQMAQSVASREVHDEPFEASCLHNEKQARGGAPHNLDLPREISVSLENWMKLFSSKQGGGGGIKDACQSRITITIAFSCDTDVLSSSHVIDHSVSKHALMLQVASKRARQIECVRVCSASAF